MVKKLETKRLNTYSPDGLHQLVIIVSERVSRGESINDPPLWLEIIVSRALIGDAERQHSRRLRVARACASAALALIHCSAVPRWL